jgi:hypothetical protein
VTAGVWFMNTERRVTVPGRVTVAWYELGERAAAWFDGCDWCHAAYGRVHRSHCFLRYGPCRTVTL